jgi:hypothetical protein
MCTQTNLINPFHADCQNPLHTELWPQSANFFLSVLKWQHSCAHFATATVQCKHCTSNINWPQGQLLSKQTGAVVGSTNAVCDRMHSTFVCRTAEQSYQCYLLQSVVLRPTFRSFQMQPWPHLLDLDPTVFSHELHSICENVHETVQDKVVFVHAMKT